MPSNAYAAYPFGTVPYIGGLPATITPIDLQVGIPFMTGNDRYQVVVCADRGTSTSTPRFRYWYANGPLWGHELADDTLIPKYFALDEDGVTVTGELQLAGREFEFRRRGNTYSSSDVLVDHVIVDFIPRPTDVNSETVSSSEPLGFSGRVEGYGLKDALRTVSATTPTFSGTFVSDTFTFKSTCGEQASDTWPNMRTARLPVRFNVRSMNIRVILTDITHCEIVRVAVLGEYGPTRDA